VLRNFTTQRDVTFKSSVSAKIPDQGALVCAFSLQNLILLRADCDSVPQVSPKPRGWCTLRSARCTLFITLLGWRTP